MSPRDPTPDFDAVIAEARALQAQLPWLRLVRVGGTAAALHARHRYSTDSDHVGEQVREQEETLRLKAWMVADRSATRDFVDVAALADLLGPARAVAALAPLSHLYDPVGTETATMRFAQAAMSRPVDEEDVDLRSYRGLMQPYQELEYVLRRVRELAIPALERELGAATPAPDSTAPTPARDEPGPGRTP